MTKKGKIEREIVSEFLETMIDTTSSYNCNAVGLYYLFVEWILYNKECIPFSRRLFDKILMEFGKQRIDKGKDAMWLRMYPTKAELKMSYRHPANTAVYWYDYYVRRL